MDGVLERGGMWEPVRREGSRLSGGTWFCSRGNEFCGIKTMLWHELASKFASCRFALHRATLRNSSAAPRGWRRRLRTSKGFSRARTNARSS
mgnify:CR=1 FL=1